MGQRGSDLGLSLRVMGFDERRGSWLLHKTC